MPLYQPFSTQTGESRLIIEMPGSFTDEGLGSETASPGWREKSEAVVAGPLNYLLQHPGKGVRSQVLEGFNTWMGVPASSLQIITNSIQMLHTASLLVDDIEDDSVLRRGLPVAHSIYGVPQTINSANYFYFKAMTVLQKLDSTEATDHFVNEMMRLHLGQAMDLYWRDSLICPTEADYLEMIGHKTGGLFRLGVQLLQTQSTQPTSPDLLLLADIIGVLFQVRDDYQNLCSEEYTKTKGYCEDITEGKFSYLVIHSIHQDPTNMDLMNILRQKTADPDQKRYAVQCMERTGSFEYTRAFIDVQINRAREIINNLSFGNGRENPLYILLDKLTL